MATSGLDQQRHRPSLSAAATGVLALAIAGFYLYIINGQNPNDLASPRVHFVFGFTVALGIAALLAAPDELPGWLRMTLLAAAAGGFAGMTVIAAASIGLLYAVPTVLAVAAIVHNLPDDAGWQTFLGGAAGFAAALATLAIGLVAFPL